MSETRGEGAIGQILGERYRLIRPIGTGGMGLVFEAIQFDLGRRVALKVLHQHLSLEPTLLARFRREALAAAALGHPNIVSVSDLQSPEGQPPFLVMELLTGMSLKQAIEADGALPAARVAHIGAQVLSALSAAHASSIVHRDIKPDNIVLVDTTAMRDFVKVLDFGVAKLQRDNLEGLTLAGAVLGTLSYMAPEQARGETLDGRADVYSVGACMYHALSGRKPFDKRNKAELYASVIMETPASLQALRPDLDGALVAIVERAMNKRASDRYASADDMVQALVRWQNETRSHAALPTPGAPRSATLTPVTPASSYPPPHPPPAQHQERRAESASGETRRAQVGQPEVETDHDLEVEFVRKPRRWPAPWIVAAAVLLGLIVDRLMVMVGPR